jgi:L,D-transpeptidase YcbB
MKTQLHTVNAPTVQSYRLLFIKVSLLIARYSYWFMCVLIIVSCQKNLTGNTEVSTVAEVIEPRQKFLVIDQSQFSDDATVSNDTSINRRIVEKRNRFYAANAFNTKWLETSGPSPLLTAFIGHLNNAASCGLNPADYGVEEIEARVRDIYQSSSTPSDIIAADINITEIFFLFAIHVREGRITDAGHHGKIWLKHNAKTDNAEVAMLISAKNSSDFDEIVMTLEPAQEQYAHLQKQLIHYRSMEKYDAQLVFTHEKIQPSTLHTAIPAIRRKLRLMNMGSDAAVVDSLLYDEALVSAIKTFQHRHGLPADGVIAGKTLQYLNQSFKEKADIIALNMERLRWSAADEASEIIHVNIPEYKLRIYEQGVVAMEMNVIVGSIATPSPVFTDTLDHIVLNPTWTVPPSLVKNEFLPRLKKNKNYYLNRKDFIFYKNGVEIDPSKEDWEKVENVGAYRIVQKPGADNALGLAKFIMPNDMNVYLHDTPDHKPFSNTYRALSHGCIRLDDPAKLAAYLLRHENSWDLSSIKKAMVKGTATKISLTKKYEVRLEYNTAWVDNEGNLNFREDIYGHDKKQLAQLNPASKNMTLFASRL